MKLATARTPKWVILLLGCLGLLCGLLSALAVVAWVAGALWEMRE